MFKTRSNTEKDPKDSRVHLALGDSQELWELYCINHQNKLTALICISYIRAFTGVMSDDKTNLYSDDEGALSKIARLENELESQGFRKRLRHTPFFYFHSIFISFLSFFLSFQFFFLIHPSELFCFPSTFVIIIIIPRQQLSWLHLHTDKHSNITPIFLPEYFFLISIFVIFQYFYLFLQLFCRLLLLGFVVLSWCVKIIILYL